MRKTSLVQRVCGNVLLLVEETLLLQTNFTDIVLSLAYSEKTGHLEFQCEAAGAAINPLEEGMQDMISG